MHTYPDTPKIQALIDATARVMIITDQKGTVTLLSKLAQEKLNISPGNSLKTELPDCWFPILSILRGTQKSRELPLQIFDQEYLVNINPIMENGDIIGAACIMVDSVQLDTMAQGLPSFQTLLRQLDTIIDSSSDGLFVCDANANVIRMNPASEKIHNLPAAEIVGRNMRELIETGFIDRSAALDASIHKKRISLLQNKNGHKLISIATPVFGEQGELIRIVVSERDITEIDNLQHELEKQQALKDSLRDQMLAMQQVELDSQPIIARSPAMIRALHQSIKVAKATSSVLLLGESGVGKGLIADLIHKKSQRADQPLIKINCGAIPESLIEAELFGYEKGAFTGAQASGKPGHFELADGGTLFLDEIAELPLPSQVKLLRFLEDGQITRLGDTKERTVDVRIIAATHQDLSEMVTRGKFRLDLYYRLNVIPIQIPSVRERPDCVLPLIRHYIDKFSTQSETQKRLTRAALDALASYSYPGNVRELMNICERLVVMSDTDLIDLPDLPSQITFNSQGNEFPAHHIPPGVSLQEALDLMEKKLLAEALRQYKNQTKIAAALNVNQSTIARKLKKHHLT
ncbi:PAS domain S-box-containing protein [Desulfuromusa kysingii]|uniref:HTH-type transcriptional regulatory protein TyrR n=1 Tax=Desulfuromusa kysingii TaxID=37625 RepID=A0A1H3XS60_9BACT|nr:sigma 54-interacting transcriptional regulator [Desulfuromusa kysingii]SEA01392.1 PAS domain S-box-containing protein [Desulfuromusa kysingii]